MNASSVAESPAGTGGQWYGIAVTAGVLALICYFFSVVFQVLPWSVGRMLFYAFGPCLTLAAFAAAALLRTEARPRPFFQVGFLFTCVAGVAVNLMAVIQDSNFTMMRESIAEAELEATKDLLRQIMWGINWVQLSLDIVFDIWIAGGCFFLALGAWIYFGQRIVGGVGMFVAALALVVNFATLPRPPAVSGLFDPGPLVATWFGCFLGLIMLWHRRGRLR